jgi:hypothetical protein
VLLLWLAVASAVEVVLPTTERVPTWAPLLPDATFVAASEDCPSVILTDEGERWSLVVCDAGGARRTRQIAPPSSDAQRAEVASLVRSLLARSVILPPTLARSEPAVPEAVPEPPEAPTTAVRREAPPVARAAEPVAPVAPDPPEEVGLAAAEPAAEETPSAPASEEPDAPSPEAAPASPAVSDVEDAPTESAAARSPVTTPVARSSAAPGARGRALRPPDGRFELLVGGAFAADAQARLVGAASLATSWRLGRWVRLGGMAQVTVEPVGWDVLGVRPLPVASAWLASVGVSSAWSSVHLGLGPVARTVVWPTSVPVGWSGRVALDGGPVLPLGRGLPVALRIAARAHADLTRWELVFDGTSREAASWGLGLQLDLVFRAVEARRER